jgi:hypothetical protein
MAATSPLLYAIALVRIGARCRNHVAGARLPGQKNRRFDVSGHAADNQVAGRIAGLAIQQIMGLEGNATVLQIAEYLNFKGVTSGKGTPPVQ